MLNEPAMARDSNETPPINPERFTFRRKGQG